MNHSHWLGAATALVFGLNSAPGLAQPEPEQHLSAHAAAAAEHAGESLAPREMPAPSPQPPDRVLRALRPGTVVYGYLPYWVTGTSSLHLDLLTHIAWFSVELNANGTVSALHGWPDPALVTAAHNAGVKVELAFTLFNASGISTLVGTPANVQTAVQAMVAQMEAGSADGVSVDFEGVPAVSRAAFTSFICALRSALTAAGHPQATISIAGPAVDWSNAFDIQGELACANIFFIMGYDFFGGWTGSGVGPSGILHVTSVWRPTTSHSEQSSVAYWANQGGAALRKKIVLGVPYYGNRWTTGSDQPGASNVAFESSVTYSEARSDLANALAPRQWEGGSKTPWYTYLASSAQHQVWYDDDQSLHAKYTLAKEQAVGGVGMWALGFDVGYQELWTELQADFGALDPVVEGTRQEPIVIASLPFHDRRDTGDPASAPSNYFDYYACAPTTPEYSREVVYQVDLCQPGALTAALSGMSTGVDIDIHLLTGLAEADCIARNDTALTHAVVPGTYYLVADTYIANAIEQAGFFTLDVSFAPSGGAPCGAGETCVAGACVPPATDGGVPDSGAVDSGVPDSGVVDSGSFAQADAGHDLDAAASPDSGFAPDVGLAADGGREADAGSTGGRDAGNEGVHGAGCGCATSASAPASLFALCCLAAIARAARVSKRRRTLQAEDLDGGA